MILQSQAQACLQAGQFTFDPQNKDRHVEIIKKMPVMPGVLTLNRQLQQLGMIPAARYPWPLPSLVPVFRALQARYRPDVVDGTPDVETCAILFALVDRHLHQQHQAMKLQKTIKHHVR